jgi:uncharacterized protein (TIGR03083 family)
MIDYLAHLGADSERIAAICEASPSSPVPSCPGWDVAALAGHLAFIQRWATVAVETSAMPDTSTIAAIEPGSEAAALRQATTGLLAALAARPADAPSWNPFPTAQVVGVWSRRQTHEASMHRWDAERAIDDVRPFDAELAADGVDEVVNLMFARWEQRRGTPYPPLGGELHLHANDVGRTWTLGEAGEHQATAAAPSLDLLLACWGRAGVESLGVAGEKAIAHAWLAWPRG